MEEANCILGPVTSLLVWRAALWGLVDMPERTARQPDLARTYAHMRTLCQLHVVRTLDIAPLDAIVGKASRTHSCKALDVIVLRGQLPPASFCQVEPGVYVCSPELCLALLGRGGLNVHLLELVCELCGTYALAPDQTGSFINCPRLTTRAHIEAYLESLGRRHGIKAARKALALSADDSDSPRETSLFLMYTLQDATGGFGLPRPALNARLEVSEHAQKLLGKSYLVADQLYRDSTGAVQAICEYDSNSHHLHTMSERGEKVLDVAKVISDDVRREVIRDEDIGLVTVRTADTKTLDLLEAKATMLGKILGCVPHPSEGGLRAQRLTLFNLLFDTKRWHDEHKVLRGMAGYLRVISHKRRGQDAGDAA